MDWLGNVRELTDFVEQTVVMSQGDIVQTEDIPENIKQAFKLLACIDRWLVGSCFGNSLARALFGESNLWDVVVKDRNVVWQSAPI
ncbi:hypothetical protein [Pseudomonas putida]